MWTISKGFPLPSSIDQKTTSRNPRSTVGTVTEIHDYLRLLYARMGVPHCPKCGKEIQQQTVDQMVRPGSGLARGQRIQVLAPVVRGRKGEHVKLLEDLQQERLCPGASGRRAVRLSEEEIKLGKEQQAYTSRLWWTGLVVRAGHPRKRLTDSLETAA